MPRKRQPKHYIYFLDRYRNQIRRAKTYNWMDLDEMIIHARAIAKPDAESFMIFREILEQEPERLTGPLPCR